MTLVSDLNITGRVYFAGFVPDSRTFLSAGEVLLLPSRKEGLPTVLLEAGIARVPTIASTTGGIPEIIEDGVSGFLVPVGDADALAARCRTLLDDPARAEALGEHLHARILREFSEDQMLKGTLEAYD